MPYWGGGGYINPFYLEGSALDLDFANGKYWNGTVESSDLTQYFTFTRSSEGTDLLPTSAQGASFTTFSSNVPRITPGLGLLVESPRTNFLLASATPATQPAVALGTGTFTLWVNGSGSATSAAGTATGSGFGAATQGSPNFFTITGAGTVSVTVAGSLNQFQLEANLTSIDTFGTSFIPTTVVSVARATDVTLAEPGTIVDNIWRLGGSTIGSAVFYLRDIRSNDSVNAGCAVLQINSRLISPIGGSPFNFFSDSITRDSYSTLAFSEYAPSTTGLHKQGASWSGTGGILSSVVDGCTVGFATEGTDSSSGVVGTYIGTSGNGAGSAYINGYMSRLVMWSTKISDSALQRFTIL